MSFCALPSLPNPTESGRSRTKCSFHSVMLVKRLQEQVSSILCCRYLNLKLSQRYATKGSAASRASTFTPETLMWPETCATIRCLIIKHQVCRAPFTRCCVHCCGLCVCVCVCVFRNKYNSSDDMSHTLFHFLGLLNRCNRFIQSI